MSTTPLIKYIYGPCDNINNKLPLALLQLKLAKRSGKGFPINHSNVGIRTKLTIFEQSDWSVLGH